jgi:hypothetical protein
MHHCCAARLIYAVLCLDRRLAGARQDSSRHTCMPCLAMQHHASTACTCACRVL